MTDPTTAPQASPGFPEEAFPCPYCGQMLAPSCRVCVACKKPIDPNHIVRHEAPHAEPQALPGPEPPSASVPRAKFSWGIFFAVLGIWFLIAALSQLTLGYEKGQFVLAGIVLFSSLWVFGDAQKKGIPKPFRWGFGCLLVWVVFFPWYLSRRRTPTAPGPFIEGEAGPTTRILLVILVALFLLGAMLTILKGPHLR
jgi:hypothetical protein